MRAFVEVRAAQFPFPVRIALYQLGHCSIQGQVGPANDTSSPARRRASAWSCVISAPFTTVPWLPRVASRPKRHSGSDPFSALRKGQVKPQPVKDAMEKLKIDPDKIDPVQA